MKTRRCNYFDNAGRARVRADGKRGCLHPDGCRYAHPEEPDWVVCPPADPPPRHIATDIDDPRGYEPLPQSSLSRRNSSRSQGPFSISPYAESPPSYASSRDYGGDRVRERDYSKPGHKDRDRDRDWERERESDRDRDRERDRDRDRDQQKGRETGRDVERDMERERTKEREQRERDRYGDSAKRSEDRGRAESRPNEHLRASSSSSHLPVAPVTPRPLADVNMAPPQPPPVSAPSEPTDPPPGPQPPPPLPPPPPFLSSEHSKMKSEAIDSELTNDEKRKLWDERVTLMCDYVSLRGTLRKIDADVRSYERIAASHRFASLPPPERADMDARLAQLTEERAKKENNMRDVVDKLIATNFWPALRQPDYKELEGRYDNLQKTILDLKNGAKELNNTICEVLESKKKEPKGKKGKEKADDTAEGGSDDLEEGEFKGRPRKKRRLTSTAEDAPTPPVSEEDFEALQTRLDAVTERLDDMENLLMQHERDMMEEVEHRIDARLEDADAELPEPSEEEKLKEAEDRARIDAIEKEVLGAGDDIGVLAKEVGEVISEQTATAEIIKKIEEESEWLTKEISAMKERCLQDRESLAKVQQEIHAVNTALDTHRARPPPAPSIPPPAPIPPIHAIAELLEPHLHEMLRPTLEVLRTTMADELQRSTAEVYETLWERLGLTLRFVETIGRALGVPGAHIVPDSAQGNADEGKPQMNGHS